MTPGGNGSCERHGIRTTGGAALTRRDVLGLTAALGATGLAGCLTDGTAAGARGGETVKFCLFADLHYWPGVFPNDSTDFLDRIRARARAADVDFVIHLGDIVHNATHDAERAFLARYRDCGLETHHVIGNHDNDGCTCDETLAAFGLTCGHYFFDVKGWRFVVCDPNYIRRPDGRLEHYSHGNNYGLKDGSQLSYMPEAQIDWLAEVLEKADGPCVVCSHQSFERERGGVPNYRAVRDVLEAANRRHPGRVRLVMNGHEHIDNLRLLNGILYYDVNSANYQWFDNRHERYPADYVKTHRQAPNTLAWNAPLSAIVTLGPGGYVRIEGSRADWLYGVTPEQAGLPPCDGIGRPVLPVMQDAELTVGPSS